MKICLFRDLKRYWKCSKTCQAL